MAEQTTELSQKNKEWRTNKMKYEKPNFEFILSDDIVVTSYLIDKGTGSGSDDDEAIIF